jgi:hypothetical protein
MIIETGNEGIPLKEIIEKLGNKSYSFIEFRCEWVQDGEEFDEFFGACSYDNKTGILTPLDGDSYSLNDLYIDWEEELVNDGQFYLTVWEKGEPSY